MAFTSKLGTVSSTLENIILGGSASITPHNLYSGIYTLVAGETSDTVYTLINYPQVETTKIQIPIPFIQTALVGD